MNDLNELLPVRLSYLIPLLPLVGAVIAGFFCTGPRKQLAHWPIWIGVLGSAILSIMLLVNMINLSHHQGQGADEIARAKDTGGNPTLWAVQNWYNWIEAGNPTKAGTAEYFKVNAGYFFDPLTAVMLCVV